MMTGPFITPVLIGRRREMETLDRALHTALSGTGGCILITGEAGIGKSRLAVELREHAISAYFWIWQGYCSEQDDSFPYAPWIDALRAFLAKKSPAEADELMGAFTPELVKLLPELSLLLPSVRPTPLLDPAAEKHRLFESITRFAISLSATHPLLILLEDLHWSDEQSLELLYFLVRRITTLPILVIGTYRSEDLSSRPADHLAKLNRAHLAEEIQLAPLARPDVSRMVQSILKTVGSIRSDWIDILMPLTEGNPFFIEEITRSLGQTESHTDHWDPLYIPRSIRHTVLGRAEALSERTRRVLSLASVIGERFDFALLKEVSAEDEQSLTRMIKELIAAQLIVEKTADQFAFRHALTREVVYASLMLRERKVMHLTIGENMERFAESQIESPAAPLAYHFFQAGDWHKAMQYSQSAGEKAQTLYAPREALTHYSHTIEAARQLGISPPLSSLHGRGQARRVLGDFDGARADYEAIIAMARRDEDHHNEWQGLMDLGYVWQPHDLERAGEYFQNALQLARSMGDGSILGQSLNRLGNWYFFRGLPREAMPLHGQALEIFQGLGDRHGMVETLALLGMASYGIGRE